MKFGAIEAGGGKSGTENIRKGRWARSVATSLAMGNKIPDIMEVKHVIAHISTFVVFMICMV